MVAGNNSRNGFWNKWIFWWQLWDRSVAGLAGFWTTYFWKMDPYFWKFLTADYVAAGAFFFSEKWPPYFHKPWASGHVAAGAFFFSEKWPPYFWNMSPRKIDNILKFSGIWSKISWFLENKKDAHRPYDQFGGSIAPRSPLCVRKRKFLFWAKIGNRSQTSCVNEKGGAGGGRGVLDLYTDALSTCLKGQLLSGIQQTRNKWMQKSTTYQKTM